MEIRVKHIFISVMILLSSLFDGYIIYYINSCSNNGMSNREIMNSSILMPLAILFNVALLFIAIINIGGYIIKNWDKKVI